MFWYVFKIMMTGLGKPNKTSCHVMQNQHEPPEVSSWTCTDWFMENTWFFGSKNHGKQRKILGKHVFSMRFLEVVCQLVQLRNPAGHENFIEHNLPLLPMTDRFDTTTFRPNEDPVEFVMNLGFTTAFSCGFPQWIPPQKKAWPSGKRWQRNIENHHISWENSL